MRIFIVLSIITIVTLLSLSCTLEGTKAPTSPPPIESPITLDFGQSVVISPSNHRLTFDSLLVEARCPADAFCIWEGFAEIRLKAVSPENDTSYIHLYIFGNANNSENVTLGYRFRLTDLSPYPQSSIPPVKEDYTATIELTLLDSNPPINNPIIISNTSREAIEQLGVNLDEAIINNDSLNVTVSYSGGCGHHKFELHMSPINFTRTTPPEVDIYIRQFSLPDPCFSIVYKDITFDLQPIKKLHRDLYGKDGNIILNIHNHRGTNGIGDIRLLYSASGLIDSTSMWPMAVGNYWIYLDSVWRNGDFYSESYDTIHIIGTSSDRFGFWWEFSQNHFFDIRNYVMINNDSIFSRDCCEQIPYNQLRLYPSLRYIPAVDTTLGFRIFNGDLLYYRTVAKIDTMISMPAGDFETSYIYRPRSLLFGNYTQILSPGIGFIYFEQINPPTTRDQYIKRSRLVEYYIQ